MMKPITMLDKWQKSDTAYARGQKAYIEFGQALAEIDATQEEIGVRYDMQQDAVSRAILVGKDARIMSVGHKTLPKSVKALYQLTTLDDEGFAELAKPDTTQAKILEYKRRLKAPVLEIPSNIEAIRVYPKEYTADELEDADLKEEAAKAKQEATIPPRPVCPGIEGSNPGEYEWSATRGWVRMIGAVPPQQLQPAIVEMSVAEAERLMGIQPMPKEVLQAIFRYQASINHPDKGGSSERMALINKAYERLQNDYY